MNIENWAYFDYFKILIKGGGGEVNYQINLLNCWNKGGGDTLKI